MHNKSEEVLKLIPDEDIVEYFMHECLFHDLDRREVEEICEYHDIEVYDPDEHDCDCEETEDENEGLKTVRDEQYDEVLDLLRDKFTVAELESFASLKS